MFIRHRFPFLLLGLGIGIILTNIFYTQFPKIEYREYTEEEIVAKATELGMVFVKENIDIGPREENTPDEKFSLKLEEENIEDKIENVEEVQFIIETGDSLIKVSKGLENRGIIDDAEHFLEFAKEKDADRKLRVGVYTLTTDLDYDSILSILMKLQ